MAWKTSRAFVPLFLLAVTACCTPEIKGGTPGTNDEGNPPSEVGAPNPGDDALGENPGTPAPGGDNGQTPTEPGTGGPTPGGEEPAPNPVPNVFQGTRAALTAAQKTRMTNSSWRTGCPVPLEDLAFVRVTHWNFEGGVQWGEIVVAAKVADQVIAAFRALYDVKYPIQQIRLVDEFEANDDKSMAANNTSAFNCRAKTGSTNYSKHSYGVAIDINPIQNPYIRPFPRTANSSIYPPEGEPHLNRNGSVPGLIVVGPLTRAFTAQGWTWGGNWNGLKDYQHFETN